MAQLMFWASLDVRYPWTSCEMNEHPIEPKTAASERAIDASDEHPAAVLQRVLLIIYKELLSHLEHELGSRDAALDALQDTAAKLAGRPAIGAVRHPRAYLRRMAVNLGRNGRRGMARLVLVQQGWLEGTIDEAPGPEQIVADGHELAMVVEALADLPDQRRAIFLDRYKDGLSLGEIAQLRSLHGRTVQKELKRAVDFLRDRLGREP